jgi:hypothetical protein
MWIAKEQEFALMENVLILQFKNLKEKKKGLYKQTVAQKLMKV